ncbi:MAG: type IV pili methyl-accepting chemotaxis transducer N-terminal domain-containing protein [Candidatus Competibacteraceae bacterium]|nr:type IV pili methyl-accepting chemotaxis transducer N-terminal domain-containing protein [Candidatus Competibacteraceae bacterium]
MFHLELGKYRNIVLSIALFIFFDLAVLVLNFVISSQISNDALMINLAGRQRMLSQRITKTALQVEYRIRDGKPFGNELTEFKKASTVFDQTLTAFSQGGRTTSGTGDEVNLAAIEDPTAQGILREARDIWTPLITAAKSLTDNADIMQASQLARLMEAANLQLLKLMNDLTTRVEQIASDKATMLRTVQVTGITLATINFIIILFHFIGHLRRSDRELEHAHKETADILRTTQEGLFLLDPELKIGSQHSTALNSILGVATLAGADFIDILRARVDQKTLKTAREYLDLLLKHDVKEKLVTSVNPLNRVEMLLDQGPGKPETRFLQFAFNRVKEKGKITHLLVTVSDITRRVLLEQELKATEDRARGQLGMLMEIIQIDPFALHQFLRAAADGLQNINGLLRDQSEPVTGRSGLLRDQSEPVTGRSSLVNALFRQAHRIKGDAAALGMSSLADAFHQLEDLLSELREQPSLSGEDFLPVTVQVKGLFEQIETIENAVIRISQVRGVATVEAPRPQHDPNTAKLPFVQRWRDFANQIATRHGNTVEISYKGIDVATLPEGLSSAVNTIINQFIRNAIVHGIESSDARKALGKPEAGRLSIYISQNDDGSVELSFRDDGRGISVQRIRDTAIAKGRLTAEEATAWDNRRIVGLIFEPGISSHAAVDADAGRGAGLDAVAELVVRFGGNVRIGTTPNEYCHFRVHLAPRAIVEGPAAT